MELRQHKTLRWMVPLAKILLLQNLCISLGHAVELNDIPDTGDSRLTQLGLNTTNTATVQGIDLYLDVTLNGANIGLTHFTYHKEQLWANPEVLKQLGFVLPTNATDQIALNDLSDVKVDYNDRQQTVEIIAPLSMLNLGTTVVNTRNSKRPQPTASPGLLLNYNLYGTQTEDTANLSAYTELRAFNSLGVLSSTALTTSNRHNDSDGWDNDTVRLDTNWSKSFPDKLLTVSAGDILTGSLSWSRSTRLGGLQFGSNFDLQPYMTTTPLPSFFGSATLPSEVELYINGLKQYSGDVPAGPFEINTAPSFSGVGNAQLVLKDALGQNTTLNFTLYDAQRLLQPGLSDWSAELGFVRENYGIKSFDYGNDIAAFGTWRYGVNNRFTTETHAEATDGLSNAGIGGTWLLGDASGVLSASLAGSKNGGASGSQYSAGYSWNNNRFNVGINAKGTHGEYRDVATKYGNAPARRSEQFSTGYNSQSLGSFGLSYNQVSYENEVTTKFASAYWSKSFGRNLRLNLNLNQDINDSDNNSVFLGASFSLDKDIYVNSSVQNTKNRNAFAVDVARSTPSAGGIGWRAQAQHNTGDNSSTNGLVELNYLSPYGEVRAGVSSNNDNYSTFASGSGSLVMMGGGLFPSRQINNSFAVVSTDGIADVPVLLQNNRIGTTNKRGLLLVTPLNAYQANKVSIDPMDLPADLRIEEVSVEATPTDRAGTLVAFNITPARSASVILIDGDRQPIPLGSQVKLSHKKGAPSAVVGFDGEVYLEALEEHNVLEVVTPSNDVCTASFDYHKQGDDIPLIGPIICQKVKQ